jgi:hypothetical protein
MRIMPLLRSLAPGMRILARLAAFVWRSPALLA